jgi:hypothetical protein
MSRRITQILGLFAFAALMPSLAAAQSSQTTMSTYPVNLGIIGGATMSNISTDDDVDLASVWGAQIGVFGDRRFNDNMGGRIEILVSQRGGRNDVSDNNLRLTYLDVPLLLKFGNMTTNDTHFHVFGGVTPGFLLKSDTSNGGGLTTDIGTDAKSVDLGAVIGAAVEQGAWALDARYTFGLVNVNDHPLGPSSEYKNRSLSINVSYRLK